MTIQNFSTLTASDQQNLVKKIGTILNDHDLGETEIRLVTEEICNLTENEVKRSFSLSVVKDLPASQAELADRVNLAIKPIVDGVDGCYV